MKRIEISIDSPAGRTVCALAEQLNLDPQDVLQGILFGLCNRRKRELEAAAKSACDNKVSSIKESSSIPES